MNTAKQPALGGSAHANRLIAALLTIGFLALIAAAGMAIWIQGQNQTNSYWVAHTLEVEARLSGFSSAAEQMETARRGLLLSDDPRFSTRLVEAQGRANGLLNRIGELTRDNPEQQVRITALRRLLAEYLAYHRATATLTGAERARMHAHFSDDEAVLRIRQIRRVSETMLYSERALLQKREAQQSRTLRWFYALLVASGVLILIVAVATLLLVRSNLAKLHASGEALRVLNDDLEDLVDARTAELQRANAEIQRFAYIVSHDLRSPLVNVMGFTAELDAARQAVAEHIARCDAEGPQLPSPAVRAAVEEDLPEAIGFIRSSTQKMDRLINAILRLSREGRRTLTPEPLDLDALVRGIGASIQHRLQDEGTELVIGALPSLTSDRVAVEQILSNLIENAAKYLKPGRPGRIEVSGRTQRDRVLIEVRDNGRGIDPRDHERIFDLFRRSGMQDQPGEGIGLAHVRALAYRLGGFIEVESELDSGSTFRVNLPLRWAEGVSNG